MTRRVYSIAAATLLWLTAGAAQAQSLRDDMDGVVHDYLASHPDEVGQIVKDYMIKHPEMLRDVIGALLKKGRTNAAAAPPPAPDAVAAIKSHSAQLLSSAHQVVLGNPKGDVTLVEFFDYSCGFCKRALADTVALLKDDPKLRIVLKEFPILGPGSLEAARVAIAVRMQDTNGAKYLDFHQRLLGQAGGADKAHALAAAEAAGLDMERLQKDMDSAEVAQTLEESRTLASDIGIRGTPGYVIGDRLIPGAIGAPALKAQIAAARARPPG